MGKTERANASGDGNAGRGGSRQAQQVRLLLLFFFLISSFHLLTFTISFVPNYRNRWRGAKWDGTGRNYAVGDSNVDGTGGRRVRGGCGRRLEAGMPENMGTAEAEDQATK